MNAAALCVTLDTVIWLVAVFVFAGLMLLSGFYEGYLEQGLLTYVERKMDSNVLDLDMRASILFVILVGNLYLNPPEGGPSWEDVQRLVTDLKGLVLTERDSEPTIAIKDTKFRLIDLLASQI